MGGGARVFFETAAETGDEIVYRAGVAVVAELPHSLEELGAAQDAASVLGEVTQEVELQLRELHLLARNRDLVGVEIDLGRAERERGGFRAVAGDLLPALAPQHRPHPGKQLTELERLDHVVVCTRLEAAHPVFGR